MERRTCHEHEKTDRRGNKEKDGDENSQKNICKNSGESSCQNSRKNRGKDSIKKNHENSGKDCRKARGCGRSENKTENG